MKTITKSDILRKLQTLPGVGKSVAEDLWQLGYRSLEEIGQQNPQQMYEDLCHLQGGPVDRCMLYTFKCAVYYCSNEKHDPKLLKWWNWKD